MRSAGELIAEVGYEAATAAEIGRRAGFSRSMVRARFGSKEHLVDAMIRSAYDSPLDAKLSASNTGLANLFARIDMLAQAVAERPDVMRSIFAIEFQAVGRGSGPHVSGWVTRLRDGALDAIRAGQLDGSIRRELDADDVAHALAVVGFGNAFLWSVYGTPDFQRHIDQWKSWILETLST